MKRAPVAIGIVAVIAFAVTWWGAAKWYGQFYGERFSVMEQRIAALQQELSTKTSVAVTPPVPATLPSPKPEPVTPPAPRKTDTPVRSKASAPKPETPVAPQKLDEFPTGGANRKRLDIDYVPPALLRDAKLKAKREGTSLRVVVLRLLKDWVAK